MASISYPPGNSRIPHHLGDAFSFLCFDFLGEASRHVAADCTTSRGLVLFSLVMPALDGQREFPASYQALSTLFWIRMGRFREERFLDVEALASSPFIVTYGITLLSSFWTPFSGTDFYA